MYEYLTVDLSQYYDYAKAAEDACNELAADKWEFVGVDQRMLVFRRTKSKPRGRPRKNDSN